MKSKILETKYSLKQVTIFGFVLIVLVIAFSGWLVYQNSFDVTIGNYKEKKINKSQFLNSLRKRLGIYQIYQTTFTILTNNELKNEAVKLVSQLRKIINEYDLKTNELSRSFNRSNWDQNLKLSENLKINYDNNYRIDALLIRKEILARMSPEVIKNQNISTDNRYDIIVNPMGLKFFADDLEKLAKLLLE